MQKAFMHELFHLQQGFIWGSTAVQLPSLLHQNGGAQDCIASLRITLTLPFCAAAGQPHATPNEVFIAIETLLPTGKGQFLELWAAKGSSRPGWTHIVESSNK